MSHERYEEWLAVYPDLTPRERDELELHLGTCAACAALHADYQALRRELAERPTPQPSARLHEGFAAAVARAQAADRRAGLWPRLARAGLALGNAAAWVTVIALTAVLVLAIAITGPELARRAWPATPTAATAGLDVARALTGREWALTALNGRPLVEGTRITMRFSSSMVSGSAGCNSYGAGYAVTDHGELTISTIAIETRLCSGPDGVMEQERAYTDALRAVASYHLAGARLALRDAAGETILTYEESEPPAATPTPVAAPAVTVARLERVEDLCCPPRFAPDGKTYLAVRAGQLWERALAGGPETARLINVSDEGAPLDVSTAAWTPDGAAIAVSRGARAGIPAPVYLVDPATGAARLLAETYMPWRLAFDARGRLVVATQTAFQALDLASGDAVELPNIAPRSASGAEAELAFSPDGRHVAALEDYQLSIVDLASGEKTPITDRTHPQWRAAFAWSTDGRQLAYATGGKATMPELWVVGADGSGARRIATRESERDAGGAYAGLAWLPGTSYIVYQFVPSGNVATLGGEYQVVSAEGGPAKTLFTNGLGLNLSPDGHLISFVRDLEGPDETGNWIAVLEYGEAGLPATATPAPALTPQPVRLTTGAVALYGVAAPQENLDVYALAADGSVTALAAQVPLGAVASQDGRWLAHLDAPQPAARAVVVENLLDGRRYTIPLSDACVGHTCVAGLCAFDREGARLASVEVTPDTWALVVSDLGDGSSRRFETHRPQGASYPILPGQPLGWAATGELVLDTFAPFSEGGSMGVWALTLPAGSSTPTIDTLERRRLVAGGSYLLRPRLSPDGTRLLYLARDRGYTPGGYTLNGGFEDVAVNQLWSLDIASGTAHKLVEVTGGAALAGAAAWSPDGREVLFAEGRYDANVLGSLVLKAADMAGAVREVGRLATPGMLSSLDWCRPSLALATVYGQASALYIVNLATAHMTFVARNTGSVLAVIAEQAGPAPAGTPAPVTSSAVDGWSGVVVKLDGMAQFDDYFERADGEKFGIDGSAAGLSCPLESAGKEGTTIRVWGRLFPGAADAYGRQIVVERIEYADGSTPPAGHVAFISPDGQLRVVGTDGQPARAPTINGQSAGSPAWSPDGRLLAYVDESADGYGTAYIYDVATGRSEPVSRQRDQFLAQVSWSPDGRYLVLDSGSSVVRSLEIVEVSARTFVSPIEAIGYAWSPDGTRLAIGRRQPVQPALPYEIGDSLSLAVLEPGRTARVILEGTADVLYRPLAWLPDGRILYLRTDWPDKSRAGQDSLWTARLDGEAVETRPARDIPLAYDPQALLALLPAELRDATTTGSFSWAPDGRWVAFHAGGYPHWGVYLFDTQAGAPPRCLADGTSPAWRP